MTIESANGKTVVEATEEDLNGALDNLNDTNNFLILADADQFIQCACSDGGRFIIEYRDDTGHYAAKTPQSPEKNAQIFRAYLKGTGDWKKMTDWNLEQDAASDEAPRGSGAGSFADNLKADLSPDRIFGSVKRQVSRELSRQVSRKTGGLVSKLLRKVIK